MPGLGEVLISDAADDMVSERQAQAVIQQLIEHADQSDLGPGCIYHTEFSLGPDEFIAGIRLNSDTFMYDVCIGVVGEELPWLVEPPPSGKPDAPPIKLRLERKPPFRLQFIEDGQVTHELPLKSLGIINSLKMLLDYNEFHSDENAGGIFEAGDRNWVMWSSDEDDRPQGGRVYRG